MDKHHNDTRCEMRLGQKRNKATHIPLKRKMVGVLCYARAEEKTNQRTKALKREVFCYLQRGYESGVVRDDLA